MFKKVRLFFLFILGILFGIVIFATIQNLQKYKFEYKNIDLNTNNILQNISNYIPKSYDDTKYKRLDEIYGILSSGFRSWSMINSWEMIQNATKAFVDSIWDPYTVYLDVKENKELTDALQGTQDFEGIWAYISKKENWILVDEIVKDSPAYKAWLKPLDTIVMIETGSTKWMNIWDAVSKIRWPAGTSVKLQIIRNNWWNQELMEKTVIRNKVEILSVKSDVLTWNIGYVSISSVGENTAFLFDKELKFLLDQKINWLILDLRWNNWWYLEIAVDICSHFLDKRKIVVTAKYPDSQQVYKSKWFGTIHDMPVVVLVDWMTASAGEIIAMALSEQIWSKTIWTKTFGKWSIQTIYNFDDNSSLKYTIWRRYSPNNININWTGFDPDIQIPFDVTWYTDNHLDNQLQRAIETINKEK